MNAAVTSDTQPITVVVEYGYDNKVIGEIDYYFFSGRVLHLFEVKSNYKHHHRDKALVQLARAVKNKRRSFIDHFRDKYGFKPGKVNKYYVTREGKYKFNPVVEYVGGTKL